VFRDTQLVERDHEFVVFVFRADLLISKDLLERLDRSLRESGTGDDARAEILADERRRLEAIRKADADTLLIDEKETFVGGLREHFNHDPAEQLPKVAATVVLIQGLSDREIAPDYAERLESAMKRAEKENFEVLRFEGLDHSFQKAGAPDPDFLKSLAERAGKYLK
jgi:pimeloyl-ACP methyl ester carboxylesterase